MWTRRAPCLAIPIQAGEQGHGRWPGATGPRLRCAANACTHEANQASARHVRATGIVRVLPMQTSAHPTKKQQQAILQPEHSEQGEKPRRDHSQVGLGLRDAIPATAVAVQVGQDRVWHEGGLKAGDGAVGLTELDVQSELGREHEPRADGMEEERRGDRREVAM